MGERGRELLAFFTPLRIEWERGTSGLVRIEGGRFFLLRSRGQAPGPPTKFWVGRGTGRELGPSEKAGSAFLGAREGGLAGWWERGSSGRGQTGPAFPSKREGARAEARRAILLEWERGTPDREKSREERRLGPPPWVGERELLAFFISIKGRGKAPGPPAGFWVGGYT